MKVDGEVMVSWTSFQIVGRASTVETLLAFYTTAQKLDTENK